MISSSLRLLAAFTLFISPLKLAADAIENNVEQAPVIEIEVRAPRVAIEQAITGYTNPVSALRYEPLVDLQGRNFAEAQGDVSVRGGIFENTGFLIGALPLFDPQTGHYFAEIPLSQHMLSAPEIYTGSQNFLRGFNSSVATIGYSFSEIQSGVRAHIGAGDFNSNLQQMYAGIGNIFNADTGNELNIDFDYARSESNGTRINGDHDFERVSSRVQFLTADSQSDLVFGYQDKFFSWPNLYAVQELHDLVGSSGVESEDIQTSLILFNHRQEFSKSSYLEGGAYYRRNKDDYEFDRFNPGLFNPFEHETEVYGSGIQGRQSFADFYIDYSSYYLADEIESTSLVFGEFSSRSYWRAAVLPGVTFALQPELDLNVSSGFTYDDSNRDSDSYSPAAQVSLIKRASEGDYYRWYAEFARTTQLPGYTAIASNPDGGLFRGNQNLSREISKNFEIGFEGRRGSFQFLSDAFYRLDDSAASPSFAARTANNVDIDTFGVENLLQWISNGYQLSAGYTYLHKDSDFGLADVDASFYALNFPRHRFTAAVVLPLAESWRLRIDNEYRRQVANSIRKTSGNAFFSSTMLSWLPDFAQGFEVSFGVDNLFKENFEEVPGVPGRGRMIAGIVDYSWQ